MNDLKKKEFNIVKNSCKLENNSTLKGNQTSSEILRSPICYLSPDWRLLPADIFGNGQQIWLTEAGCRRDWMAGKDGRSYINFYNFPFFFCIFFALLLAAFACQLKRANSSCASRASRVAWGLRLPAVSSVSFLSGLLFFLSAFSPASPGFSRLFSFIFQIFWRLSRARARGRHLSDALTGAI